MHAVIVGGGAAGMSCASVLKRTRPEADATVLEAGNHVSYSACGMPHWIGGRVKGGPDSLVVLDPDTARQERDIDVRTNAMASDVDPDAHQVTVQHGDEREHLDYDALVLAAGVEPRDPFNGRRLDNVFAFRHLDDAVHAQRFLEQEDPDAACIVGGGFIGIEMSEALTRRGVETTLIEQGPQVLANRLAKPLAGVLEERMREAGITVRTGQAAQGLRSEDRWVRAVEMPEGEVETDVAVLAAGTRPRNELAREAGCELTAEGGIVADETMRTSVEDVFACGDGVAYEHRLTGERVVQPLALHANRSGRVAGSVIAGEPARFPGVLGTAASRFVDVEVALTGLTVQDARRAGLDVVSESVEARTRAGYDPDAAPVHVQLVAEAGSGRVLGGQIVGGEGAGKRIDTVASAIWMGATCEDVEAMDLAYAPPISPTWDPVAIAARMTGRRV